MQQPVPQADVMEAPPPHTPVSKKKLPKINTSEGMYLPQSRLSKSLAGQCMPESLAGGVTEADSH